MFEQANKDTTGVLCIGMENSAKFGKCVGAEIDAKRMYEILKTYSNSSTLLLSNQATKNVVIQKIQEVCKKDLAIIFYSGHGGEQKQTATTKQKFLEPTGKDQFLCLYDQGMFDDEIWVLISQAKGRVVLIFDCCHSATMYRTAPNFEAKKVSEGVFGAEKVPNMICFSGCPDNTFSYGDVNGGLMTNAFISYFKSSRTYGDIWKMLHSDKQLNAAEIVQFTELGKKFKDYLIFR